MAAEKVATTEPSAPEGSDSPGTPPVAEVVSRLGEFEGKVEALLAKFPEPEITLVASPMIYRLMGRVLAEMPAIGKDQYNEGQRFKYQGMEDILDALNPILSRVGVFFVPEVIERLSEIRTTAQSKNLWTVHLLVRYTFYAPDGSSVVATSWGEGTDSGDKATSKAMTMALKACLRQTFAISDHEEPDPDGSSEESRPPETLAEADRAAIQAQIDALDEYAAEKLRELWIAQKGNLPALKNATPANVSAILALISQADADAVRPRVVDGASASA